MKINWTLPLGNEGVNILDVGTGPAPTPYAIQDFDYQLRSYGIDNQINESFSNIHNQLASIFYHTSVLLEHRFRKISPHILSPYIKCRTVET